MKKNLTWIVAGLLIVAIIPLLANGVFLTSDNSGAWVICLVAALFGFIVTGCIAGSMGTPIPIIICNLVVVTAFYYTLGGKIGWICWSGAETLFFIVVSLRADWAKIKAEDQAFMARVEAQEKAKVAYARSPEGIAEAERKRALYYSPEAVAERQRSFDRIASAKI